MTDNIPEVAITMTTVHIPAAYIPCAGCGKLKVRGIAAQRNAPSWVHGYAMWYVWSRISHYILRKRVWADYHAACLPPGWSTWRIELAPDLQAYHAPEIELDLIRQIAAERND